MLDDVNIYRGGSNSTVFIVFFEIPLSVIFFIMMIAVELADMAGSTLYDAENTICIAAMVMFAVIGIAKVISIIRNSRIYHLILPSLANDAALCRFIYCALLPLLSDNAQGSLGFLAALFLSILSIVLNLLTSAAILKSRTNKDYIIAYVLSAVSVTVCMVV